MELKEKHFEILLDIKDKLQWIIESYAILICKVEIINDKLDRINQKLDKFIQRMLRKSKTDSNLQFIIHN